MMLSLFPMLLCTLPVLPHRRPPSGKLFHDAAAASPAERQLFRTDFRFAPSSRSAPASCFRWLPVPAAPPRRPGQQLRYGAPASNKSHPAEKSTPVWLAIWRTWAGFANSQLLSAAFLSLYLYICAYPRYCNLGAAAQTDANLSAHLYRLPTPPPYLRQMRLLPGRGAGVGY